MANQGDKPVKAPAYQLEAHDAGRESHPRAHARVYEEEAARVLLVTQALEREERWRLELARETEPSSQLKLD